MVILQILSKVLDTKDNSIITDNLLTIEYFTGYEKEYTFIQDHYNTYGNIPDKSTFLSNFPDIELVEVAETDEYLVRTIREEHLFTKSVPILQRAAQLLKTDANEASIYIQSQIQNLQPTYELGGTDIVSQADIRLDQFNQRRNHQEEWFFTSGFEELDDIIHGIQRQEELFVIVARTNQGKSWILEKIVTHIWQIGFNVGFISAEMGSSSIGYRFDTLTNNISNRSLMWGDAENNEYSDYIQTLKTKNNKFIVSTPKDFNREITVSKLKNWVAQHKLDVIAIDGITYLTDERAKRGDNKSIALTNISEDLMALSVEIGVPVLIVVQANRSGVPLEEEGTPELEHIRDSDGIAYNASKVISIRQKKDNVLEIGIKKQRNGAVGGKLNYKWDIDRGIFTFIPSYDDAQPKHTTERNVNREKQQHKDKKDVF